MSKFKKMTVEEIQNLRNEYEDKLSKICAEFQEKTDLAIYELRLDANTIGKPKVNIEISNII